jgi:hypothetical protein
MAADIDRALLLPSLSGFAPSSPENPTLLPEFCKLHPLLRLEVQRRIEPGVRWTAGEMRRSRPIRRRCGIIDDEPLLSFHVVVLLRDIS